jgi:hypothetical protein
MVAWHGFSSSLRSRSVTASCAYGDHRVWWDVEARDRRAALALLPDFVADRSEAVRIADLTIP